MAFQQPGPQTVQRAARSAVGEQDVSGLLERSPREPQSDLSRTWVLFSPPTEITTASYLSETERSIQTLGRSHLSDLGSLNTRARTAAASSAAENTDSSQPVLVPAAVEESAADDAELDSLDGHLPGFRSLPSRSHHIFPRHDGLGSFRLDRPALGPEAQDQIYQFERFNPRRTRRRFNSFEQAQFELEESAEVQEAEKRQRIEAWRLEHSRILLEEIQRETRSRQKAKAASRHAQQSKQAGVMKDTETETEADFGTSDWHEQEDEEVECSSLLERVTRTALRELLGIDDRLLSILLGDNIPGLEDLNGTSQTPSSGDEVTSDDWWQLRVLERVSNELGLLATQLSSHPGAFSTYSRTQHTPLPYAGLPVILESGDDGAAAKSSAEQSAESMFPEFQPTALPPTKRLAIPRRKSMDLDATYQDSGMGSTFTQEEWEREMDIKLVFRYLVSRFTSRSESSVSAEAPRHNISKPQDTAAKAARVRHHPLISRSRPPVERRPFKAGGGPSSPAALRHHSSCASQSTRRSARRSSVSSRHYWDIGGSLKTGSVIASNGPMGSWGEV